MAEQILGKARVVAAAHRGGGVDDDYGARGVRRVLAPFKTAQQVTVSSRLGERPADRSGQGSCQWLLRVLRSCSRREAST